MTSDRGYQAIFFDLDGTLIDTAPDMVTVLMDLQREEGIEPLEYDVGRSHVSNGAVGLVSLAFPNIDEDTHERLRLRYLEKYQSSVCVRSHVFPGIDELLNSLDTERVPWGVVTNKPMRMTDPLLAGLGLTERTICAISGDTLPQRKPDPAPLFLAAEQAGMPTSACIYVGDAARDIEAGRAAGMHTVGVEYGYIANDPPSSWGADVVVADPAELTRYVLKAVNLVS